MKCKTGIGKENFTEEEQGRGEKEKMEKETEKRGIPETPEAEMKEAKSQKAGVQKAEEETFDTKKESQDITLLRRDERQRHKRSPIGTMAEKEQWGMYLPELAGTNHHQEAGKTSYYRASIEANHKIFADEVVKHKVLALLWEETIEQNYEVVAFTLLDDQLQLVLAKHGADNANAGKAEEAANTEGTGEERASAGYLVFSDPREQILGELFRECRQLYDRPPSTTAVPLCETSSWEPLEETQDLLRECCDIHQLPVKEGYVDQVSKYWWSSYLTYRGKYYWKFLNIWNLLEKLSPDPQEAVALFEKEQRRYTNS